MAIESLPFAPSARLPSAQAALAALGVEWPSSPLNTSFLLALVACAAVYIFLWHTRAGYQLRAVGASPGAAAYAGIRPQSQVVRAMAISGALAGMVGMNEVAGVSGKLVLEFVSGAGFTGIAVALMGRNHPLGIVVSSLLFGALFQGGAEVAFDVPGFSREVALISSASVYAQTQIAACQNPKGYMFYPFISPIQKSKSGWTDDAITGGKSILTKNANGQLDIVFIDSIKKTPISSVADGGKVILLRNLSNQLAVLVAYDTVTEIYTYWKTEDGQLQFSLIQSKSGLIPKSGALVGTCEFINFNF
jgi:hypothetical protein